MAIFKHLFVFASVCATVVFAAQKPKITILDYSVIVDPNNPSYGEWVPIIAPDRQSLSMKTPMKADITEELNFRSIIKVGGEVLMKEEMLLCDVLKKPEAIEMAAKYGRPEGKYTTMSECPIKKCDDCELVDVQLDAKAVPPGTPAAEIGHEMIVFKDDAEKPYMKMLSKFKLEWVD